MIIFWHHVGREHGENGYASDIRKNTPNIIENCLMQKRHFAENISKNQFLKYNETTLLELPPKDSKEKFIIVYCLDKGLQYSYGNKNYPYWLVDICHIEEMEKDIYCVHDLFIDIVVNKDMTYHVLDVDDFQTAIKKKVIDEEIVVKTLGSLSIALDELNNKSLPKIIKEIEEKYLKT
jgi:hypothetical protein